MERNWNKYRNVCRNSNSNQNIVETEGKMDTHYTYVHDRSILRVGTRISLNSSVLNYFCMCPNLSSYWNDVDM
jgi:hypothetical protein